MSNEMKNKPLLISCLPISVCLLIIVWCLHTHSVSSLCHPHDKSLLLEFKNNITFTPEAISNYSRLQDWNESTDCCQWAGVDCGNSNAQVIGLELFGHHIVGDINNFSSLFRLPYLQSLILSDNNIQGSIPWWVSSATNLVELDLSSNNLNGRVTAVDWGKLVNLKVIDLSYNSFSGSIPTSLFMLPSLHQNYLQDNNFSGKLNVEFTTTASSMLQYVDLSNNTLEGPVPKSIFQWRELESLDLSSNRFNGTLKLVEILQSYKHLYSLYLSNNNNLYVDTNGCGVNSSFPQLRYLHLSNCNLHSLPKFLKNQTSLFELDLSMNQISGIVPMWIWDIYSFSWSSDPIYRTFLNLSGNHLVEMEQIPSLNISSYLDDLRLTLDLHSNNLHGTFPLLPFSIDYLDCSNNHFTSIHPHFLSLSQPSFLSFSYNNLHGSILTSLCKVHSLSLLNLAFNYLNGTIPSDCLDLFVLNLRGNYLGGKIPDTLEDQDEVCLLQTLDLNGNLLQGRVPQTLAKCKQLKVLDLGNNHLNDTFPCHLKSLTNLQVLILRSNNFHGTLSCPTSHHSIWPMLQIVDLSSNHFSGELRPQSLFNWTLMMMVGTSKEESTTGRLLSDLPINTYYQNSVAVTFKGNTYELKYILTIFSSIDFSNNLFYGKIPRQLGNLNGLIVLNLSHNSFSGSIPPSFGNLSQIQSLDLSCNSFSERIPPQLANLNFLEYLNLSSNKLSGRIPTGTQLQSFNASSYEGNQGLYGPPLTPIGRHNVTPKPDSQGSDWSSKIAFEWMLMGAGVGFPVGITVFLGPLLYIKRYREWYCNLLHILVMKILRKEDHTGGRRNVRQNTRQQRRQRR